MLTSLRNTHSEFLKALSNNGTATYTLSNGTVVPVIYSRKSGKDFVQIPKEGYPLVSILDYMPEFSTEWNQSFKEYVDGYHDFTGVGDTPVKAYLFKEPIQFIFKYDFTIYTNNADDKFYADDFFLKTFGKTGKFTLNKVTLPDDSVIGDPVTYTIIRNENVRSDGIYEMNYEFSSKVMVQIADPEEVDLVTNWTMGIFNVGL